MLISVLKKKTRVRKLILVLAISMLIFIARKKTTEIAEDNENLGITVRASENDKNLRSNLAQVLYI